MSCVSHGAFLQTTEPYPWYFVGREAVLADLTHLFGADTRRTAVALHGAPGCGKTALAQRLASDLGGRFQGALLWAQLGARPDTDGILDKWGEAVGIGRCASGDRTVRSARLRTQLAQRDRVLVVLDDVWDFEPADLLAHSTVPDNASLLITTRDAALARRLGCRVWPVGVLSTDDAIGMVEKQLGPLGAYRSDALELVRLLGCLPLAIRITLCQADHPSHVHGLIAALAAKHGLSHIVIEGGGGRNENLETSFELSYERLDTDTRRCFRALGAFADAPFSAEAAMAVFESNPAADVVEDTDSALRFLVRRGLLECMSEGTFVQHPLLREYARALLVAEGELQTVQQRHAAHYWALLESGQWQVVGGALPQMLQAWQLIQQQGATAVYARWQTARPFLSLRRWSTYIEWTSDTLRLARSEGELLAEGALLRELGYTYWKQARYDEALACLQECISTAETTHDLATKAVALNLIGLVHRERSRWDEALGYFAQSLALHRQGQNPIGEAWVLQNIGLTLIEQGLWRKAEEPLSRSLEIFSSLDGALLNSQDRADAEEGLTQVLNTLSRLHFLLRQYPEALDSATRALARAAESGDRAAQSRALRNLGRIAARLEHEDAGRYLRDSLAIARDMGHRRQVGRTLNDIGEVELYLEQYGSAASHLQEALHTSHEIGDIVGEAGALLSTGRLQMAQLAADDALDTLQRGLVLSRQVGCPVTEALLLRSMARAYMTQGCAAEAADCSDKARAILGRLGLLDLVLDDPLGFSIGR